MNKLKGSLMKSIFIQNKLKNTLLVSVVLALSTGLSACNDESKPKVQREDKKSEGDADKKTSEDTKPEEDNTKKK